MQACRQFLYWIGTNPTSRQTREGWRLGLLAALTFLAYSRVATAGLIWNDGDYVTQPRLRSLDGLRRIWCEPGATQQYYPVLHSVFWLEHRLWGGAAQCYHLVNVLWHTVAACLFYLILRKLSIGGAWLAALIFALHPVCVESVAWISEQKNTLSAAGYLSAALCYLRWREKPSAARYFAATLLFILAILSKSMTATLPAALLVVMWWKNGRLSRRDFWSLAPWLAMGVTVGLFTGWVERVYVGAQGPGFGLSPVERSLIAGRACWFYLGKLIWPFPLIFIYPRWTPDPRALWQYGFPLGGVALTVSLWTLRGRARAPLAAWLLFVGTLFPVLGFLNVYAFIYSFVADHWQYLAGLGMFALAGGGLARAGSSLSPAKRTLLGVAVVIPLGILTWRQCGSYHDSLTFYRTIISHNPAAWMAHNNLGLELQASGRSAEAEDEFRAVIRLRPGDADAYRNLGCVLTTMPGRLDDAIAECRQALRLHPGDAELHNNLANAWLKLPGRTNEAIAEYEAALRLRPDYAEAHYNLGNAWLAMPGRLDDAIREYEAALRFAPDDAEFHYNLGLALAERPGRQDDAMNQFEAAAQLRPDFAQAHNNLAILLKARGRVADAVAEYEQALRLNPMDPEVHNNLANALAEGGRTAEAIAQYQAALRLAPDFTAAHFNLALVLLRATNSYDYARRELEAVVRLQPANARARRMLSALPPSP